MTDTFNWAPTRRNLLKTATGALAASSFGVRSSAAAASELVIATFGGNLGNALRDIAGKSYAAKLGLSVVDDPSGPLAGRIRSMVQENNVIWDACDSISYTALRLGKDGLLAPIDYSVVDKSKLRPEGVFDYGINYGAISVMLVYDSEVFKDNPPTSWADFFDVTTFPGRRAAWQYGYCWEAALLADGVATDKLYPLDTDRAIAKFRTIRDQMLFFSSGPEQIAALRDGEVSMAILFSNEYKNAFEESKGRLKGVWKQGLKCSTTLVVPRKNPAGEKVAMGFLAHVMTTEIQLALVKAGGIGPGDPALSASLPEALAAYDPNNPKWATDQIQTDDVYYADNEEKLIELFIDKVASN